jgi:hypothetical protein
MAGDRIEGIIRALADHEKRITALEKELALKTARKSGKEGGA